MIIVAEIGDVVLRVSAEDLAAVAVEREPNVPVAPVPINIDCVVRIGRIFADGRDDVAAMDVQRLHRARRLAASARPAASAASSSLFISSVSFQIGRNRPAMPA